MVYEYTAYLYGPNDNQEELLSPTVSPLKSWIKSSVAHGILDIIDSKHFFHRISFNPITACW